MSRKSFKKICNVGYKGNGKYLCNSNAYKLWYNILHRCYDEKTQLKQPTYIGCTVDPRWFCFQNFAEWYYQNYVETYQLDKDLLIKDNKIYGPDTCCFLPRQINTLIVLQKSKRTDTPIGVSKTPSGNRFRVMLGKGKSIEHIGYFDTVDEAFKIYKIEKESYIKEVAEFWKDRITEKVYNKLIEYSVSIDD